MLKDQDTAILADGLTILSQCRRETGDIWQAHYGAASIAGYFFAKANRLTGKVEEAVAVENRRIGTGFRKRRRRRWKISGRLSIRFRR
ncbi:hypothetical protein [Paenibacillus ihbetae]|uniref:hypothetical protein n=1 Tax=Paenibacillus ihbetae TaxID=1870820 RepID=UPI001CB8A223|nr:hypothetical protein [Paenibacillus ihbetae]